MMAAPGHLAVAKVRHGRLDDNNAASLSSEVHRPGSEEMDLLIFTKLPPFLSVCD